MMLVYRDNKDFIQASIDFYPTNGFGKIVSRQDAINVWVEQVEVSKGCDGKKSFAYFIRKIGELCPNALSAHWWRKSKSNGKIREWTRFRLMRRRGVNEVAQMAVE